MLLLSILAICGREEKKVGSLCFVFWKQIQRKEKKVLLEGRNIFKVKHLPRIASDSFFIHPTNLPCFRLHCSFNFILVFVICILPLKANLLIWLYFRIKINSIKSEQNFSSSFFVSSFFFLSLLSAFFVYLFSDFFSDVFKRFMGAKRMWDDSLAAQNGILSPSLCFFM